jgi:hypothetical protein
MTSCVSFLKGKDETTSPEIIQISPPMDRASLAGICLGQAGNLGILLSVPSVIDPEVNDLHWVASNGTKTELVYKNTDRLGI